MVELRLFWRLQLLGPGDPTRCGLDPGTARSLDVDFVESVGEGETPALGSPGSHSDPVEEGAGETRSSLEAAAGGGDRRDRLFLGVLDPDGSDDGDPGREGLEK